MLSNITYSFYLIAVISISQQMLRCKPRREGGGEEEEGERKIEERGGKREEEREGRKSHWLDLLKCLLTLRTVIHCSPQWGPSVHRHLRNRARTQSLTRVKLGVERGDPEPPHPQEEKIHCCVFIIQISFARIWWDSRSRLSSREFAVLRDCD